ncbi:hypothetical protein PIB30_085799 [Stylosanthes scabra]|uniref:Uncharacterized protein n=1 Tax=Stylosanthes scabra TaxID=79078 RepID=A0ABU6TSE8_9FABA|nr:hypothetical protein [Stylosanthes scabra]
MASPASSHTETALVPHQTTSSSPSQPEESQPQKRIEEEGKNSKERDRPCSTQVPSGGIGGPSYQRGFFEGTRTLD